MTSPFTIGAAWAGDVQATDTDKEQAKRLVALGDERMAAGDYRGAWDAYRGADVLMGVPTTGLQVARAEVAMGRLVEARATLDRVRAFPTNDGEPAAFTAARQRAAELVASLDERTPKLTVVVSGAPVGSKVLVTVDGTAWKDEHLAAAQSMNPGEHEAIAWVDGRQHVKRRIALAEKDRQVVELVIPTLEPRSGGLSPLVPIGFGAGAVGLVVGIVTGVMSLDRASEVKQSCFDGRICPRSMEEARDESVTLAHVATGSFVLAGVGVVVGVVGLAIGSGGERARRPAPLTADGGGMRVRF